jgi:hypothetical protein
MPHPDPPAIRRKPAREVIARINGALSRGPTTEAGKRRSSMNATVTASAPAATSPSPPWRGPR